MAAKTKKENRPAAARTTRGQSSRGDQYRLENVGAGSNVVQGRNNKVNITNVYRETPPSVEEEAELKKLDAYVQLSISNLTAALQEKKPSTGNPYRLLEALNIHERDLLAGREVVIGELIARLEDKHFTALAGENGIGKTSLLRAGLLPALAEEGHWPIRIETTGESLDVTVKKSVFGSLEAFPALAARSMNDAIHLAAAFLPDGKDIVLLVDNLEEFFSQPFEAQEKFTRPWKNCINDPILNVRWLFCMAGVTHRLSQFQSGEINPFANLTVLGPLDRAAAKEAILAPARSANLRVDDALLDALLDDLGNEEVDPTRLQIVCHTLAGGNASINTSLDLPVYEKLNRADGILRAYLDRAIGELPPAERDPAWQILAFLEASDKPLAAEEIGRQLSTFGYRNVKTDSLLETLGLKHLVKLGEEGYRLASASMKPRIREWREQEAVPRQIQKEAARQLEQIRNSALRGLLGGAIGLGLFRWIVGTPIRDLDSFILLILLYGTVGGMVGLLLTFSIDVSIASYHGSRQWLRYLTGGLVGASTFGLALALFAYLSINSDAPLLNSILAAFEGGVWGLVAGLGTTWAMSTSRPAWIVILSVPIAGGIALSLANILLNVLTRPQPLQIAAGGLIFPLFIAIGVRLGRRAGGTQ